jgi:hypothetical protein
MSVSVSFLRGEQHAEATRSGSAIETAIARLLDGPTGAEQRKGLRTQLPEGVTLKHVVCAVRGVAAVGELLRRRRRVPRGARGLRLRRHRTAASACRTAMPSGCTGASASARR